MITRRTADRIAYIHAQIEAADALIKAPEHRLCRDGRQGTNKDRGALAISVDLDFEGKSNSAQFKITGISWSICRPIVEAHVADLREQLEALNSQAMIEGAK